jgi:hypothetical protein
MNRELELSSCKLVLSNSDIDGVACQREAKGAGDSKNHRPSECIPVKSAKKWSGGPLLSTTLCAGELILMTWITTFAVFAFLGSSYPALAQENNGTGPVRLNAPRVEAPPPVIKPKIIQSPAVAGNVGAGHDAPQQQSRTDRPPLTGEEQQPVQQVRPRAAYREITRRINIAGGVLALPKVVYYGVPVILDVPGLGFVDVPEDEYARLYEKLSSSDSEQVQEAMSSLRRIKALEESEVEAHERGPERTGPGDIQDLSGHISKDLSEPIFFHSRGQPRSRRLY